MKTSAPENPLELSPERELLEGAGWLLEADRCKALVIDLLKRPKELAGCVAFYETAADSFQVSPVFARCFAEGGYSGGRLAAEPEGLAQLQRIYLQRHCQAVAFACRRERAFFRGLAPGAAELASPDSLDEMVRLIRAETAAGEARPAAEVIGRARLEPALRDLEKQIEAVRFDPASPEGDLLARLLDSQREMIQRLIASHEAHEFYRSGGKRKTPSNHGIAPD